MPDGKTFERMYQIILQNTFWCAKPDSLNDKDEFIFRYDYTVNASTRRLLPEILSRYHNTPADRAALIASSITAAQLENIARPVVDDIIGKCRKEIGLVCFSLSKNDVTLWKRYGGCGNGLCIEIDVPDAFMQNGTLHEVDYVAEKVWRIDSLFESALSNPYVSYKEMLLTKTAYWEPENEVRFVSKRQDVPVTFTEAVVTEIVFGGRVCHPVASGIKATVSGHSGTRSIKFSGA